MTEMCYHLRVAPMFLSLLVSSIFSGATAQLRTSNISLGSSLTPTNNSYWTSDSGNFAFGFYSKGEGFAIGIWFAEIRQKTVVWTANRDELPYPGDSTLILDGNLGLIIQLGGGQRILISNVAEPASSASMLSSGNFVLYNSESKIIWQTFDSPTDTILPGQRLLAGNQLVSSASETNYTSGKFQLIMQNDGNLVQYPVGYAQKDYAYWNSLTNTAGNNVSLNLDGNGQLYLLNATGFTIKILEEVETLVPALYVAKIDADGMFRLYSHSSNQQDIWSVKWSSVTDKCAPIGLCGENGYCAPLGRGPQCICLPGFHFIDQGQKTLRCIRNSSIGDCSNSKESTLYMDELQGISWIDNPYSIIPNLTKADCRKECTRDCKCEAAVYQNEECRKQNLPLNFGRIQRSISDTTLVKLSGGGSGSTTEVVKERKAKRQNGTLIVIIVFSAISVFVFAIYGVLIYKYRVWKYKRISGLINEQLLEDVTLRPFTYNELENATNNFTDEIGKGAFGTVFRGMISKGNRIVAIKRLDRLFAEGERGFCNEIKVIGRTYHKNLVRLLGYCHDGTHWLLVYEYMTNGSLKHFLFGTSQRPAWEARTEIALNIARGIHYLHEECETQIIHCDIKPENILMDAKGCAKVADFGLSKLLMPDQSKTYTGVRGTRGYVAPEWHRNLPITVKADVYSYGIMLLEIICCRRHVDLHASSEYEVVLANWVQDCFEAGELDKVVEGNVEEVEKSDTEKMVKVALWCIQEDPSLRPSMKKVVLMLEGTVEIPPPPSFPSCSSSV